MSDLEARATAMLADLRECNWIGSYAAQVAYFLAERGYGVRPAPADENEREALAKAICAADEQTLDHERCWPDPPFNVDGLYDEQWKAYLPHADAVLAALRVSAPETGEAAVRS